MTEANDEIINLVADIVSAYVSNNSVPAADLPARSAPQRGGCGILPPPFSPDMPAK